MKSMHPLTTYRTPVQRIWFTEWRNFRRKQMQKERSGHY